VRAFADYALEGFFVALEFVLIWWVTTRFLAWNRARSSAARQRLLFKLRLPDWIKWLEFVLLGPIFGLSTIGSLFISFHLYELLHAHRAGPWAQVLILVPGCFLALMFSLFAINFIEWVIPPLRRADEKAMEGLPAASFHQSNKDFLHVVEWASPACLALWIIGFVLK
jgi:hypothetical protein